MSDFTTFSQVVRQRFELMADGRPLFRTTLTGDQLWEHYLASFPEGTNPIFRTNTEHDCSCCRNFIKNIGNAVTLRDDDLSARVTVWDAYESLEYPYDVVGKAMADLVARAPIASIFHTTEPRYSTEKNFEPVEGGAPLVWNHFSAVVPAPYFLKEPGEAIGSYASAVQVFRRGLTELNPEAVHTVLELIKSDNLYRGSEHLGAVAGFMKLQAAYLGNDDGANPQISEAICWLKAKEPGALIRNTAIGTLLIDLSEGVPLEQAVASFENKVSGTNYKRPKALVTPAMIAAAMKDISEDGLEPALYRRMANLGDVSINNVIWADNHAKHDMKGSLTSQLLDKATSGMVTKDFGFTDIDIAHFMSAVVPNAVLMDVLLKNEHINNLMTLTTETHEGSGQLFKWGNPFSWVYNGGFADSVKERVKRAGGNTNAPLRVSLAWFNGDDLDIHMQAPGFRGDINFMNKQGALDVDMNAGGRMNEKDPVENVSFSKPRDGIYKVAVNNFNKRSADNVGFVIEVENNGTVTQYSYKKAVGQKETVQVGTLEVVGGVITKVNFSKDMQGTGMEQEVWGVKTETFRRVETLMFSPNYWDGESTGNKHWFFMLQGLKNPEPCRAFLNEHLKPELDKHRKALELIGANTKCEVASEQLSGVGFSSTVRNSVNIRVKTGTSTRIYNVHF